VLWQDTNQGEDGGSMCL